MKLVAFFLIALFVHGPLSPLLPTAIETALLYYARLYPAWLLALVGTAGATLAELANYHLLSRAARLPLVARLGNSKGVQWSLRTFQRAPFLATALGIFSPIPDSVVRIVAALGKYPLRLFLPAIALGRFPRLFLVAALGRFTSPPLWILALFAAAALAIALLQHRVAEHAAPRAPAQRATALLVLALAGAAFAKGKPSTRDRGW